MQKNSVCNSQVSMFNTDTGETKDSKVIPFQSNIIPFPCAKQDKNPSIVIAEKHRTSPITDKSMCDRIQDCLLSTGRYGLRNWLIFTLGIAIGRRAGDLLSIRIKDVFDGKEVRNNIAVQEHKTGKIVKDVYIGENVRRNIRQYIEGLGIFSREDYLFTSQKKDAEGNARPLNVRSYAAILRDTGETLNAGFGLSTHDMRKTFGRRYYDYYMQKEGGVTETGVHVLDYLQALFGHSSRLITLRYIGVYSEEMQSAADNIDSMYFGDRNSISEQVQG